MLSIEKSKEILNRNSAGLKYTDEDVKKIRDVIYQIANLDYECFKIKCKRSKLNSPKVNP